MKPISCFTTALLLLAATYATAGELEIEEFTLRPAEEKSVSMKRGDAFEVGLKVKAVKMGEITYVIRTTDPVEKKDAPPALTFYESDRQFAFLAEKGDVQLTDNGPLDLATAKHEFRTRISTKDWKPGRWYLGIFAHNTKDRIGGYQLVRALFAVDIQGNEVKLINMENASPTQFVRCELDPPVVKPGQPTVLRIEANQDDLQGVKVEVPNHLAKEDLLPDFVYNEKNTTGTLSDPGKSLVMNNGTLDKNPALTKIDVPLTTDDVKPGLYFMTVQMQARSGGKPAVEHLALSVPSPNDRLKVRISKPWVVWKGSSAGRFTRLADGTLVLAGHYSTDHGKTWIKPAKGGGMRGGCDELKDGSIITMDYSFLPIADKKGWYSGKLRRSNDAGRTVQVADVTMNVPQAKAAQGHGFHKGPLCTGSFVQRADGSLVALMMGWFEGDDELCPYGRGRPYSRTYVCESFDEGKTWQYLSTVGYDHLGSEGYNEGAIEAMPNGDIVAVARTGNMADRTWHDNPVMFTRSTDGGKTWAKPWRIGVNGCLPDVELLSDGMLAISTGRPGAYVVFSADGGQTWTDLTLVDAAPYSGYTALIETQPGEILVVFAEGYQRPDIENLVKMAYVWYEKDSE